MNKVNLVFNYKKATQELNHFALKEGECISKLKALKLIYLADRYHLRKYGRLITNDIYFARNYGPVPSSTKDIAEASSFLDENEEEYSSQYVKPIDTLTLKSVKPVDKSVFSDSDLEALEFVWDKFGHLDQFTLTDITHKYPEWERHKKALSMDSRIQMNLEDFFEDPNANIDKCFELSDQDKVTRREHLADMAYIESLWS